MMRVFAALCVLALVGVAAAQRPQDKLYNGCFCFFEWNTANEVGNWTFEENWLQLEEPPEVAFVSISGDATVTVDKDRTINSLTIGANRWDRTQLVLDQDLRVFYNDQPTITAVRGKRLVTGVIELTIEGRGFGFQKEDVVVSAFNYYDDDDTLLVDDDGPVVNQNPEAQSADDYNVYDCDNLRLAYRDEKVVCQISTPDILPQTFFVRLRANGNEAQAALISKFIK